MCGSIFTDMVNGQRLFGGLFIRSNTIKVKRLILLEGFVEHKTNNTKNNPVTQSGKKN